MTREEVLSTALQIKSNNICLELPTSFGKTLDALTIVKERLKDKLVKSILIVVPKNVLKKEWDKEIDKWNMQELKPFIVYSTYVSLPKQNLNKYDCIIYDECFRGDTEILTLRGFVKFEELLEDDVVAQWDNGIISFVKPIRLIKHPYDGLLKKVHLGRGRYCYMTPNHNQVYRTTSINEWRVKPIKDLAADYRNRIPVSGKGSGNNNPLTPLEQLYIAIQADGTLQRHQKNESVYSIQVTRERKKQRLTNILSQIQDWTKIKTNRPNTDRYLCKLPKGDAKLLSTHFSVNMGYDRAESFIQEIAEWDGSRYNNMIYYSSKIRENVDFVASVAVQAGYKALQGVEKDTRNTTYSDIYRIYLYKKEETDTQPMKKNEYISYKGNVFCVEVPSHKIVVRSQGYTFISGNCHHLTDRCVDAINTYTVGINGRKTINILLSATIKPLQKIKFTKVFYNLQTIKVQVKDAINERILPDPEVLLLPLRLNKSEQAQTYIYGAKNKVILNCNYANRWNSVKLYYKNPKTYKVQIACSEYEYYQLLNNDIEYATKKCREDRKRQLFIKRLKWLSDLKTPLINILLKILNTERTLTFCNSIDQCEQLGKYPIHSGKKELIDNLNKFNIGEIDHITSCAMLNEGANIFSLKVGIFAYLTASDTPTFQKMGRCLRHQKPVIIIPYYQGTREGEIVEKMKDNFNPEKIHIINYLNEIKSYLK